MREADIRPADLLNEYLRLSAEDATRLFSDSSCFNKRACPGCGSNKPDAAFENNGFSFALCGTCRTLYANPAPAAEPLANFYRDRPSQQYLGGIFSPAVAEARRKQIFQPRVARIQELAQQIGSLDLDPFARHLLDVADQQARANFQTFFRGNKLSSHIWVIARKPI